jgi:hypothetical protein
VVSASPDTVVAHNTVLLSGTYFAAIEYRFQESTRIRIINNLTDAAIRQREGAAATVEGNYTQATPGLFKDVEASDLHLTNSATVLLSAAIESDVAPYDWDGDPRTHDARREIGGDEVVKSANELAR